jgi:C4-dicarboxylate transporter DctM subunit
VVYRFRPAGSGRAAGSGARSRRRARRAALPWLMVLLVFLVITTYVPEMTLWLPNLLF